MLAEAMPPRLEVNLFSAESLRNPYEDYRSLGDAGLFGFTELRFRIDAS